MLNLQAGPNGRSAGTVSWGGIFNTYYWLDPAKRVTGLIMTQILPFADPRAVKLYGQLERGVTTRSRRCEPTRFGNVTSSVWAPRRAGFEASRRPR